MCTRARTCVCVCRRRQRGAAAAVAPQGWTCLPTAPCRAQRGIARAAGAPRVRQHSNAHGLRVEPGRRVPHPQLCGGGGSGAEEEAPLHAQREPGGEARGRKQTLPAAAEAVRAELEAGGAQRLFPQSTPPSRAPPAPRRGRSCRLLRRPSSTPRRRRQAIPRATPPLLPPPRHRRRPLQPWLRPPKTLPARAFF